MSVNLDSCSTVQTAGAAPYGLVCTATSTKVVGGYCRESLYNEPQEDLDVEILAAVLFIEAVEERKPPPVYRRTVYGLAALKLSKGGGSLVGDSAPTRMRFQNPRFACP
jgi:hypothetical protein